MKNHKFVLFSLMLVLILVACGGQANVTDNPDEILEFS